MTHIERVQKAIDYIEENLSQDLDIEDLCKVSGFSRWHFQIVFSSVASESVKEYIRKRRLSESAIKLIKTKNKIIDIALEAGYESQESYSRAFKNVFKLSPGEFREQGESYLVPAKKLKITADYLNHLYKGVSMEAKFTKLPQMEFVGVGGNFISVLSEEKNNHIVIPQFWQKFMSDKHKVGWNITSKLYGICMQAENKTHPEECFYLAGIEKTMASVPDGMVVKNIPAGEYAVFTHKGFLNTFEHTLNYIYGSWLPKSGKKLRNAPDLEIYDERFKLEDPNSQIDIYIPIE